MRSFFFQQYGSENLGYEVNESLNIVSLITQI